MGHGGRRSGAGRPKGARNIRVSSNKKTRAQTGEIVARALKNDDVTPLQAMLKNLAVIVQRADEMLQDGVPVDDARHLALRKLLQEIAAAVAPYVHPRLSAVANLAANDEARRDAERAEARSAADEFRERIRRLVEAHHRSVAANVVQLEPVRGNGGGSWH